VVNQHIPHHPSVVSREHVTLLLSLSICVLCTHHVTAADHCC
jgi:hypothetical protein